MTLEGKEITCTDLRMSASMIFASLMSKGQTILHQVDYLDRGYENFVDKLNSLGADIKVYEE